MKPLTTAGLHELKDDLDKLAGRGRHRSPSNICYLDGYFARSLEQKYGASIEELEALVARRDAGPAVLLCDRRPHHDHQCDRCRRLAAIGAIVWAITLDQAPMVGTVTAALDAVAFLLIDRAKLVADHRKELNQAILDGQNEARASYAEGEQHGRTYGGDQ